MIEQPNSSAATPPIADPAPCGTIPFKDDTIRYLRVDSLPWLSVQDTCRVLSIDWDNSLDECVNDVHKGWDAFPGDDEKTPWISPIGAFTLTTYHGRSIDYTFQRWLFKEIKLLQPDGFDRKRFGAAQCMALQPSGRIPPRPHPRSGRAYERDDLKFSRQYRLGPPATPRIVYASTGDGLSLVDQLIANGQANPPSATVIGMIRAELGLRDQAD